MDKDVLFGKTLQELKRICADLKMPSFTATQIAEWIYKKKTDAVGKMTNLSVENRKRLDEKFTLGYINPSTGQHSADGTIKYLFPVKDLYAVETVYIPDSDRATLCVSSQVGCKMNCLFCMTGKQGFSYNLSPGEILNQIHSVPERDKLTNVVFMGMGEPMDNTDNLLTVLEIMTSSYGYAWSPKRITVSTIGQLPGLKRFLEESDCHLAISLHSPYPEERKFLMPVEKAYPITKVLELIRRYDFSHQRRVSFEYIMFHGLNDDLRHAKELVKLLSGISCRVNLIRYHSIPGIELKSSNEEAMTVFRDYLISKKVMCTIRTSRGEDIFAACGMLSTMEKEKKNVI